MRAAISQGPAQAAFYVFFAAAGFLACHLLGAPGAGAGAWLHARAPAGWSQAGWWAFNGSHACHQEEARLLEQLQRNRLELPEGALARGLAYVGTGRRLQRFAAKLRRGQPVTVVLLGGSITCGNGMKYGRGYKKLLADWLNAAFPPASGSHIVFNGCQQATTSAVYAVCLREFLPQEADLVVLEFAVNDASESDPGSDQQHRRSYEQVLRGVLRPPAQPAVVALELFSWAQSRGLFHNSAENSQAVTAQYYDVPLLSVRNAVYHYLRTDLAGFKRACPPDYPPGERCFYSEDMGHPSDFGHRVAAELVISAIAKALGAELECTPPKQQKAMSGGQPSLPPPMFPDNEEVAAPVCVVPYSPQEPIKGLVLDSKGFTYQAQRPNETEVHRQKRGWIGQRPGAWLLLSVNSNLEGNGGAAAQQSVTGHSGRGSSSGSGSGNDISQPAAPGRLAEVHLLHVKSWQQMGTAEVACVANCRCNATLLDGHWERQASLTSSTAMQVTQHADCRLNITIRGESRSGGHSLVLVGLVVTKDVGVRMHQNPGQWEPQDFKRESTYWKSY